MYFCDQHLLNIVMTSQKASGYPGYKNKNKIYYFSTKWVLKTNYNQC